MHDVVLCKKAHMHRTVPASYPDKAYGNHHVGSLLDFDMAVVKERVVRGHLVTRNAAFNLESGVMTGGRREEAWWLQSLTEK